jgi:predicted RNase H-related nuclease YkuK (DUF458 family)
MRVVQTQNVFFNLEKNTKIKMVLLKSMNYMNMYYGLVSVVADSEMYKRGTKFISHIDTTIRLENDHQHFSANQKNGR